MLTLIFVHRVDDGRGVVGLVGKRAVYCRLEGGSTGDSSELPVTFLAPVLASPVSLPQEEAGQHYTKR